MGGNAYGNTHGNVYDKMRCITIKKWYMLFHMQYQKKYAFPGLKSVTCTFPYTFPFGTFFTKKNISAYAFPYTFPGKAYGNAYGFRGSVPRMIVW